MIPVVAIVGRPNVGKSTLFNELTRSRDALVVDLPGVTRDRQYGEGVLGDKPFIVIDTGGLVSETHAKETKASKSATASTAKTKPGQKNRVLSDAEFESQVADRISEQVWQAVNESDLVFFLVDARAGLTALDQTIANKLRQIEKPLFLIVNKTDGLNSEVAIADFFQLGLGDPIPIAASHGRGVTSLIVHALKDYEIPSEESQEQKKETGIKISIIGKPNVGKSTLVNRMLGFERVVVFDKPGTTRDSIYIPLEREGQNYTIIDTAGVRRKSRVSETIEKFSIIKTLQAIEASHVAILVIDAREGVTDQDLGLLGFVVEAGRALVIAINKWDGLTDEHKQEVKRELNYRLAFANFAKVHFISALHGSGVGKLFDAVKAAYESATREITTAKLTRTLERLVSEHAPPMIQGRRIKLRYAHAGGHNPPLIVIHGNQTEQLPESYRRYLMNGFRKLLKLQGTPIRLEFKTSENPYAGRRNKLTPRQEYKRKRMIRHRKKK